jgi:uncharacterized membrane protein YphA (DoxX/SURF4 family)
VYDPHPVHPERRTAALDSAFSRGVSCSTGEFGGEMPGYGLSNIAQQNTRIQVNMRFAGRPLEVGTKMNPITVFLTIACLIVGAALVATGYLVPGAVFVVFAIVIASALKMANTWQKFVILRAGKLRGVKGPGLFLIIRIGASR